MGTAARLPARLLVNIDVPDLAAAEAFYTAAFGVTAGRRFGGTGGGGAVELIGLEAPLYLLENAHGSATAGTTRDFARHWTPVHLDVAVDDIVVARETALAAGARAEGGIRDTGYGRIATFADPFGHGFCLIRFSPEGYDAIAA